MTVEFDVRAINFEWSMVLYVKFDLWNGTFNQPESGHELKLQYCCYIMSQYWQWVKTFGLTVKK